MGVPSPTTPSPRFARYRPTERDVRGRHAWAVPEGGLCLSTYLILTPEGDDRRVLLGRPSLDAPWEAMAALQKVHLNDVRDRWILPASHLREFESPTAAARRIATEELGDPHIALRGPETFSEAYPSPLDPESGDHWDFQFIFRGSWPREGRTTPAAWRELRSLETAQLSRRQIARGHGDVLELAGFALAD